MAVPKSKITRSKRGMRRAHDSLKQLMLWNVLIVENKKFLITYVNRVVSMVIKRLHL